jgi:hypothetical protein
MILTGPLGKSCALAELAAKFKAKGIAIKATFIHFK